MADASSSMKKVKNFICSGTSNSVETVRSFLNSQIHDEEKWALNMKLLRAAGMFAGSILLMRNYGDLMAI
ncbi:mitochondrial import receptor subunit TOM5 homolog [Momordica charantia]|uniref:Mitochondrial import receptor subunit TOM5 homolog n=1 Tax=Momordica charantia TaxID=3673 RepID=A0A6J1C7R9_MOMCH|nr:mitochondrial import receptor subunit TOM5 homolog [Momordica charantia]